METQNVKKANWNGLELEYNPLDKSLTINGKMFSYEFMENANRETKGINRIHKPIGLLFWIDCKNGDYKNWTK